MCFLLVCLIHYFDSPTLVKWVYLGRGQACWSFDQRIKWRNYPSSIPLNVQADCAPISENKFEKIEFKEEPVNAAMERVNCFYRAYSVNNLFWTHIVWRKQKKVAIGIRKTLADDWYQINVFYSFQSTFQFLLCLPVSSQCVYKWLLIFII